MTSRKLRRSTLKQRKIANSKNIAITPRPLKKKRPGRPRAIRYTCTTCLEHKTTIKFPHFNPSAECEHDINTCTACLKAWGDVQIESGSYKISDTTTFGIRCPECPAVMRNVNVQAATSSAIHTFFETMEQKYHMTTDPKWRWCLAVGCDEGQIHAADAGNVCTCWKCGARVCIACDKPYREGEVCEEYRLRTKEQLDEEKLALSVIKSTTQKCPACKAPVEKRGGCNSMGCICGSAFYWV